MTELLCAVGVVPTRVYPKSGRISALAGRQGRLRACMTDISGHENGNYQRQWR
ncbi:TPA: replication protein RepA4 [Escherichia coli]|nr:replication protein RepA4 [Escherichia coli]HAJ7165263.1 replication protein RepA4 [Escherichia coli]HAJ7170469.1 replication protein RepA4 [Escherichia coli]HAJ7199691.1 replication protein RepA4 [Escherichia coli]